MKLRNTAIAAALSLIPVGQPLMIGTGAALTSTAVMLTVPQKVLAEDAEFYFNRRVTKGREGDFSGALDDYSKAIEINPKNAKAYYNRGYAKKELPDLKGACDDWKKAAELGVENAAELLKEHYG